MFLVCLVSLWPYCLLAYFQLEITGEKLYDFNHQKEVMSKLKSHIYHIIQLPNRSSSASDLFSTDYHRS